CSRAEAARRRGRGALPPRRGLPRRIPSRRRRSREPSRRSPCPPPVRTVRTFGHGRRLSCAAGRGWTTNCSFVTVGGTGVLCEWHRAPALSLTCATLGVLRPRQSGLRARE